jgi:Protein of unknown function (DUF3551)
MKSFMFVLGVLAAAAAIAPAQAQNYPWCEYLGGADEGGRNCGFTTYQQCMASAFGNGGDCQLNPQYEPPAGSHQMQSGTAPLPGHHARKKSATSS